MSDNKLLSKLSGIKEKFEKLSEQISEPSVMSDMKKYISLNREYRELEPLVEAGEKYKTMMGNLSSAKDMLMVEKDDEMREKTLQAHRVVQLQQ